MKLGREVFDYRPPHVHPDRPPHVIEHHRPLHGANLWGRPSRNVTEIIITNYDPASLAPARLQPASPLDPAHPQATSSPDPPADP